MNMRSALHDLYHHQAWADAEHWRLIAAFEPAREDQTIRTRLHHIHVVQHAFRWMTGDRTSPMAFTKADEFPTLDALREYALHSQHHRGQNATRLRELGAAPENTDYIIWLWKGRPAPTW